MKEITLNETQCISGAASDDTAWAASIAVSGVLIGIAIAASGPVAMGAVFGSYAASIISTRYVSHQ